MTQIVLVCGGRDYADGRAVFAALDQLPFVPEVVVHGDARGVDRLAARWAQDRCIHSAPVRALWDAYGKKAGHLRNATMLLLGVTYVVAFPGGRGTEDMVAKATAKGLPVWRPYN